MNQSEAREEIHQWLRDHDDPEMQELAESWKEVGDMMEAGLSAEEVLWIIHKRAHKGSGKAIADALGNLKNTEIPKEA